MKICWGPKNVGVQKMFGSEKKFVSEKCSGLNFLGDERNLAPKRFVKKNSSKKNFVGKR